MALKITTLKQTHCLLITPFNTLTFLIYSPNFFIFCNLYIMFIFICIIFSFNFKIHSVYWSKNCTREKDRGGWQHSLDGCRGANGPASSWLHWCATVIALLHLGLEAAHGGRRSSLTANSSWNSDYVCPLASETIKYSETISLAISQCIFFVLCT